MELNLLNIVYIIEYLGENFMFNDILYYILKCMGWSMRFFWEKNKNVVYWFFLIGNV